MPFLPTTFSEHSLSYSDYVDAGKPMGKTGYPAWLHKSYTEIIAAKDKEIAQLKKKIQEYGDHAKSICT